jgi:hypothetical protein
LEALSDAQVVAPAAKTVDLHSADHRNSFLYVFDYQTKNGDYPQVSENQMGGWWAIEKLRLRLHVTIKRKRKREN